MIYARVSFDVRHLSPVALVLLLSIACGGATQPPTPESNGLEGREVVKVVIEGNRAVSDRALIRGLHHHNPKGRFRWVIAKYNAPALALDRKRIEAYYRSLGYFNARVNSSRVSPLRERVKIVFEVFEGAPARIIDVHTIGVPPETDIDPEGLAANAKITPGRVMVHKRYLALKSALQRALERAGYAHAEVDGEIRVDREKHTAAVQLRVDPGPRVKFGAVHVEGNSRVPDDAVRDRVVFHTGERYDPEKLDKTAEQIRNLGTFSSVRTELQREGRPAVADTYIRLSERKHHEVKLGGGGAVDGARTEIRARADYANRMTIHPLITFRGSVRPGFVVLDRDGNQEGEFVVSASSSIQRQDLLLPLLSATVSLDYDIESFEAYTTIGPSTTWRLSRPFFERKLSLSTAWHFTYLHSISPEQGVDLEAKAPYRLAYVAQTASLDLRDRPTSTTRGMYSSLTAEYGHPALGGTMQYRRLLGDLRGYYPVLPWLVVAARVRGGVLDVIAGDNEPFTRRFFSGGSTSHRGFGFRSLSPRSAGKPVGGNTLLETGFETRSPIGTLLTRELSFALFLDGGDVTTTFDELDTMNLHWASGFGFRVDTPAGPLRLDLAYRLNRIVADTIDRDRLAVHFTIGDAF